MSNSTDVLRAAWAEYECKPDKMVKTKFGPDIIRVAPETLDAWKALESVLLAYDYIIRVEDTDSYNCRDMKSGDKKSLHSYGIALDINWKTNPYIDHAGQRKPRFSTEPGQSGRAQAVRLGKADTDMSEETVNAALAIRTKAGKQVFGWGGAWRSIKDAMHFQIELTPEELAQGIDWSTVAQPANGSGQAEAETVASGADTEEEATMELPKVFFDTVRSKVFGGALSQAAVDNMNAIVGYWLQHHRDNPLNQLAYIFATVRAEVGANMQPVREGFAKTDADARAILANRDYAKPAGPFGHAYYGRGYVQLTHLDNYKAQSEKLGVDLVQFPDRALETPIALKILVGGMLAGNFNSKGHGLGFYVNETKQDFVGARWTVNRQDRAVEIAGYAEVFLDALKRAGSMATSSNTSSDDIPTPTGEDLGKYTSYQGGSDLAAELAETNRMLRLLLDRLGGAPVLPGPVVTTAPSVAGLSPEIMAIFRQLSSGSATTAEMADVLAKLQNAGLIKPGQGLTPVNNALGETVGKALDGKKTVIGIAGLLISVFLPQLAPLTSFLTDNVPANTGAVESGKVAVESVQNILTPLASIIAAWGGLGKIDKWMHKPAISTTADLLNALRK